MRRVVPLLSLALLLVGCAASSHDWLREQEGFAVSQGFVIDAHIPNPKITVLKDGKAYEITEESTVVLEFGRGRRKTFELNPGDFFLHGRPYAYVLVARRGG